jgi:hypothetical protein
VIDLTHHVGDSKSRCSLSSRNLQNVILPNVLLQMRYSHSEIPPKGGCKFPFHMSDYRLKIPPDKVVKLQVFFKEIQCLSI